MHYQTVDGDYYFLLANKIRNGQDFVIEGLKNASGRHFSPYPPGYPLLLNVGVFFENTLQLSAVLCLHFFLIFVLGWIWIVKKLPVISLITICFTDTFMELACNQWSEFSFIIALFLAAIWISEMESKKNLHHPLALSLFFFFIFLIRYAGIFTIGFIILKLWQSFREKAEFKFWLKTGVALGILVLAWFSFQIWAFGQPTGGDRYANNQTNGLLAFDLLVGIANQILIFKDWSGSSYQSFVLGLIFTVFFLIWALFYSRGKASSFKPKSKFNSLISNNLIYSGLLYFLFIIPLRWYFYFAEGYDFRLLGPGTILILLGFSVRFFIDFQIRKKMLLICLWVMASCFFSLPKKEIYLKFQERIWGNTETVFPQSSP